MMAEFDRRNLELQGTVAGLPGRPLPSRAAMSRSAPRLALSFRHAMSLSRCWRSEGSCARRRGRLEFFWLCHDSSVDEQHIQFPEVHMASSQPLAVLLITLIAAVG